MKTILSETVEAYADCNNLAVGERNLDFLASAPVTRDEAVEIMGKAVVGGYNEFTHTLLKKLPADSEIWLAREGSVCVYVKSREIGRIGDWRRKLKADEVSEEFHGRCRIWWD